MERTVTLTDHKYHKRQLRIGARQIPHPVGKTTLSHRKLATKCNQSWTKKGLVWVEGICSTEMTGRRRLERSAEEVSLPAYPKKCWPNICKVVTLVNQVQEIGFTQVTSTTLPVDVLGMHSAQLRCLYNAPGIPAAGCQCTQDKLH